MPWNSRPALVERKRFWSLPKEAPHILKHALAVLRPEVADLFRFIDVSKGHPFPGTGTLIEFAEGLAAQLAPQRCDN